MPEPLTPERVADIRERAERRLEKCRRRGQASLADLECTKNEVHELAAEIDRLRVELDNYKDHLGHLERHTLPQLRREIQHHQDGKKRWRDRAEKAEARVVELERPAVEAKRNEIRSTYTELISQAEQDRDFEGAATLTLQLRESEEKWAAEDTKGGAR